MGLLDIFGSYSFEMKIQSVFIIKNHGVVITGIIDKGEINIGDEVIIKGKKYTVILIDAVLNPATKEPQQVKNATEGTNVAIHLNTLSAANIKSGFIAKVKQKN